MKIFSRNIIVQIKWVTLLMSALVIGITGIAFSSANAFSLDSGPVDVISPSDVLSPTDRPTPTNTSRRDVPAPIDPGILPTSPFYPLDEFGETLRLAVTRDPNKRAKLVATYAQEKVAEVHALVKEHYADNELPYNDQPIDLTRGKGTTDAQDSSGDGTSSDAQRFPLELSEIEPGWIEIYNPNTSAVQLEGFKVTVSSGFVQSYDFTVNDGVIPPEGYYVAEATVTNLNIPSVGGIVRLSSTSGFHQDVVVPSFVPDSSYAWLSDMNQWNCTLNRTFQGPNLYQACSTRSTDDRTPQGPGEVDERQQFPKLNEVHRNAIELVNLHPEDINLQGLTIEVQNGGTSAVSSYTVPESEPAVISANGYILFERAQTGLSVFLPFTTVRLISSDGLVIDQTTVNTDLTTETFAWALLSAPNNLASNNSTPSWECTSQYTPLASNRRQDCGPVDPTDREPPDSKCPEETTIDLTHGQVATDEDCPEDDPASTRATVRFNEIHRNAFEIKNYSNINASIKDHTIEVRVGGTNQVLTYTITEDTSVPASGLLVLERAVTGLSVSQPHTLVRLLSPGGIVLDQVEVLHDPTIETNSWSWLDTSQWNCTEHITLGQQPNVYQACSDRETPADPTDREPPDSKCPEETTIDLTHGQVATDEDCPEDDPTSSRSVAWFNEFTQDKVEFYNAGNADFSLAGWRMSVQNPSGITEYVFPNLKVPAIGYLTVPSSKSSIVIPVDGGIVRLYDPAGIIVKEVTVPAFPQNVGDVSYSYFSTEPAGFIHTCTVTTNDPHPNQYQACSDREQQPEDIDLTHREGTTDSQDEPKDEPKDDANEPVNDEIRAKADLNEVQAGFIEWHNPSHDDYDLTGSDLQIIKLDGSVVQYQPTGVVLAGGYLTARQIDTGITPEIGDVVQFRDQSGNTQTVEISYVNAQSSFARFADGGWDCTGTVTETAENILSDCLIVPEEDSIDLTQGQGNELDEDTTQAVTKAIDKAKEYIDAVHTTEGTSDETKEDVLQDIEDMQDVLDEVANNVVDEVQDIVVDAHAAAQDTQDVLIDEVIDQEHADELKQEYGDDVLSDDTLVDDATDTLGDEDITDETVTDDVDVDEELPEEVTDDEEVPEDVPEELLDRTSKELLEDSLELAEELSVAVQDSSDFRQELSVAVQEIEKLRNTIRDLEDAIDSLKDENRKLREQLNDAGVDVNTDTKDEDTTKDTVDTTTGDTTDDSDHTSQQPDQTSSNTERVDIQLRLLRFIPNEITVASGTTIRFINKDKPKHRLQFSDGTITNVIEPGQSFEKVANSAFTVWSVDSDAVPPMNITVE